MKLRIKHMKRIDFLLLTLFILIGIYFGIFIYLLGSEDQNTEIANYIIPKLQSCPINYASCYYDLAKSLLDKYKLPEILIELEKGVVETESIELDSCHKITHYLGREAYKRNNNIRELFTQCSQICMSGCFHGVIEEHLKEKNLSIEDDDVLEREIQTLCGSENDFENLIKYQECFHGLGHGLMFLTENDLPRALRLCESLSVEVEMLACQSGVFMENSNSNADHPSKYIKEGDFAFPCNTLDKKYHDYCYVYQSSRLISIGKNDWKKNFELCYTHIPKDYWSRCFLYIGVAMASNTSTLEAMKANCEFISNNYYRNYCIVGVAEILSRRSTGDFSKTIKFCSLVDQENKNHCYTIMGQEVKKWARSKSEMIPVCSKILEEEYKDVCIAATKKQS